MQVENAPFLAAIFNEPANKYISMLAKDIILLHNARVTRSVAER
jgi:hypothetical protein